MTEMLTSMECWDKAYDEFPRDSESRRARYKELMIEHGHIVKREPGESRNLPCGWPHAS